MRFGVNTWVWVSPLTTEELKKLAPVVKSIGFDWIEVPFESLNDLDFAEGAKIIRDHGLGVSACAAMSVSPMECAVSDKASHAPR